MRKVWALALGAMVTLPMLAMAHAVAAEDVERFCDASLTIGGRLPKDGPKDPRQDRAFARRLASGYNRVAKYASAGIAIDMRALAAYYRELGAAKSSKDAVAIANRRYTEITARQQRLAEYVSTNCMDFPAAPSRPAGPYVDYEVGGEGRAIVTYVDASGAPVSKTVALPWDVQVAVTAGQAVRVTAEQQGNGIVYCKITYDDGSRRRRSVANAADDGDHVAVTCEGTI